MFDAVYCIHLPNAERKARMEAELARFGMSAKFIHADQPPSGFTMSNMRRNARAEFGVNLSHVKAIIEAIRDGADRPMFIEDDVLFAPDFKDALANTLNYVTGWDIMYLGGHPRGPVQKFRDRLVKVSTFCFAEAYILRGAITAHRLLDSWCSRISQPNAMFDFILSDFASKNSAYAFYPCLTEQYAGFSQVGNKMDDKRELVKRGWANHLK